MRPSTGQQSIDLGDGEGRVGTSRWEGEALTSHRVSTFFLLISPSSHKVGALTLGVGGGVGYIRENSPLPHPLLFIYQFLTAHEPQLFHMKNGSNSPV